MDDDPQTVAVSQSPGPTSCTMLAVHDPSSSYMSELADARQTIMSLENDIQRMKCYANAEYDQQRCTYNNELEQQGIFMRNEAENIVHSQRNSFRNVEFEVNDAHDAAIKHAEAQLKGELGAQLEQTKQHLQRVADKVSSDLLISKSYKRMNARHLQRFKQEIPR